MSETINEMLGDISNQFAVDEDNLSKVAQLAAEQTKAELAIAELERELKHAKFEHRKLVTEIIPDFMDEVGLESFTLSNGRQLKVDPFYQASIPKDRKDEAHKWLIDNDYAALLKVTVAVHFGKDEYEKAAELCKRIEDEFGYPVAPAVTVHPMTLKGWVRMMAEESNPFPLDLFGAFIGRVAKLK